MAWRSSSWHDATISYQAIIVPWHYAYTSQWYYIVYYSVWHWVPRTYRRQWGGRIFFKGSPAVAPRLLFARKCTHQKDWQAQGPLRGGIHRWQVTEKLNTMISEPLPCLVTCVGSSFVTVSQNLCHSFEPDNTVSYRRIYHMIPADSPVDQGRSIDTVP
jgi:hypothetical protein